MCSRAQRESNTTTSEPGNGKCYPPGRQEVPLSTVVCKKHGEQQATYLCQHIVNGLIAHTRIGFFWTADDSTNPRPDAWCSECER